MGGERYRGPKIEKDADLLQIDWVKDDNDDFKCIEKYKDVCKCSQTLEFEYEKVNEDLPCDDTAVTECEECIHEGKHVWCTHPLDPKDHPKYKKQCLVGAKGSEVRHKCPG